MHEKVWVASFLCTQFLKYFEKLRKIEKVSTKKIVYRLLFDPIVVLAESKKRYELTEEIMLFLFQRDITMLFFKIVECFSTTQKAPKLITFLYSRIDPSLIANFITQQWRIRSS